MIASVSNASIAHFGANNRYDRSAFDAMDPRRQKPGSGAESGGFETTSKKKEKEGLGKEELTPAEKQQVQELKARDAEVRAHEMAHMAAAGSLAMGGPNYVYQTGPDGKNYAIGGDVKIDTSPGRTPEETARKAATIRAAALAPSDPSPQDIKVAAAAASMDQQAQQKIASKSRIDPSSPEHSGDQSHPFSSEQPQEITDIRQLVAYDFSEEPTAEDDSATTASNGLAQPTAGLYKANA